MTKRLEHEPGSGNRVRGPERRGGVPKGVSTRQVPLPRSMTLTCRLCSASFRAAFAHARYCSPSCREEAKRLRRILCGQDVNYESFADRIAAAHMRSSALSRTLAAAEAIRASRDRPLAPYGQWADD